MRRRPAVGPARPDHLLRPALSRRSTARSPKPARSFLAIPSAFTRQTGEAHWHVLMRARAIENGCFVLRGRAGRRARERPRDLRPFAGRRSVGPRPRRRRHRAGRGVGRDRSGRGRAARGAHSLAAARPALRDRRADGGAGASARGRRRRMIRYALGLRQGPRLRELVPEFRRLRQAGEARARRLSGLRLGQGREGDHGAAPRRARDKRAARRPSAEAATDAGAGRGRRRRSR